MAAPEAMALADCALMACCAARYHHDAAHYGATAFMNLFLSEDCGLDLHFAQSGQRIALERGVAVVFDTAQPHAVIHRNGSGFHPADYPSVQDCSQMFLTWELPLEDAAVVSALGVRMDTARCPTATRG